MAGIPTTVLDEVAPFTPILADDEEAGVEIAVPQAPWANWSES
jgi:hypothetical protein